MTVSPIDLALDYIYSFVDYERQRTPNMKTNWDLRRVEELLARLGNPHLKSKTVHVAGSKGKGSTAVMVAAVLSRAGYKTGLYTSPHLHVFNERIRIDSKLISDDEIVELMGIIKPEVEVVNKTASYGKLTTFEIITIMGFLYFAQKKTDYQVIEVGLGGRLDATNVVNPEVSVITPVSYEHMDLLGNTLTAIASEKAGIIKQGGAVVSSPQTEEADLVIETVCTRQRAKLIKVGRDVSFKSNGFAQTEQALTVQGRLGKYEFTIPLLGQYQLSNAATAIAVLEVLMEKGAGIPSQSIIQGMRDVSWEGRLQVLNRRPLVVADGAHNQDSARKLRAALEHYFKYDHMVLVIGMSSDKDLTGIVNELAPICQKVVVTRSTHPRAMDTTPIASEFRKYGIEAQETNDITQAMPLALSLAGNRDLVCVTGSLFVAAGAIEQANVLNLKP